MPMRPGEPAAGIPQIGRGSGECRAGRALEPTWGADQNSWTQTSQQEKCLVRPGVSDGSDQRFRAFAG